jgi:ribose/xylose/arabinose/galactoside ABC-type transport system permease subunit
LLGILALFTILIGLKGELQQFLSLNNLQVLMHEATIPGVVALGTLLVIISGGIDLSVGSVVALVTVVAMQVYRALYERGGPALPNWAAILCGVGAGGLCGLVNGLVITGLKVPPFVATLGILSIARGMAAWLSERRIIAFPGPDPGWVRAFNQVHPPTTIFNAGFWSLVLLATLTVVFLRFTVWGRYTYAIGSNEATARLCGLPILRMKALIYTVAGLLAGWAGILHFAHGTSGDPSAAVGLELEVIAAVVVGGASLSGGKGTVLGTLLGVLILGVLANGVNVYNVPVEVQYILIGIIIIGNTALSQWRSRET